MRAGMPSANATGTALLEHEPSWTTASGERPIDTGEDEIRARLAAGDARGAIASVAVRFGPAVGRVCFLILGSQAEAEEAAQETMLAAYDAIGSYRADSSVRAWVFGIARRVCAQRVEVRTRQARRRELMVEETFEEIETIDGLVDRAQRNALVREALDELSEGERAVVLLRFDGELSYREIAQACGIDEAAARKRVGRALGRLRQRLSK